MLEDTGADSVTVARLLLASANGAEGGKTQQCDSESFHEHVHFPDLQSIAHEEGDANVQNGEDCEGVTKGAVNDVPELKNPLGAAEKGDAL